MWSESCNDNIVTWEYKPATPVKTCVDIKRGVTYMCGKKMCFFVPQPPYYYPFLCTNCVSVCTTKVQRKFDPYYFSMRNFIGDLNQWKDFSAHVSEALASFLWVRLQLTQRWVACPRPPKFSDPNKFYPPQKNWPTKIVDPQKMSPIFFENP